jgi:transposase
MKAAPQTSQNSDPSARIAELEQSLAKLRKEYDDLRSAYDRVLHELSLLKRRIFLAKAERVDTKQLEIEFAEKLAAMEALAGTLGIEDGEQEPPSSRTKNCGKPRGRRNLGSLPLEKEPIDVTDPLFEKLVAEGKAEAIGYEESDKLGWKRGGMVRLRIRRVKYRTVDASGESALETAAMPPQLLPRCLAAPSMLAHTLVSKFNDGLPFARLEEILARDGVPIDRGTMCRWAEDLGGAFGATIVEAMRRDALSTAFCIASDATGIRVQPEKRPDKARQACRRGHYFVMIADRDHIWFEYTPRETSAAVNRMLGSFSGYVQVDAKSVFDVLFRDEPDAGEDDDASERREVGCWAHARRKFWEAATAKSVVAREALARISRVYDVDRSFKGKPPSEIKRLRDAHLRVHVESFFAFVDAEYETVREVRGSLRSALGYAHRQRTALSRFLDDGRLRLDNNPAELALRGRVAVGRKAWLFVGSDGHAETAANIMSLVASARLHRLDPEAYLRDMIRVLPHWPRDRYLELSPKHWAGTRSRLDDGELRLEIGDLQVPDPTPDPPAEEPSSR